MEAEKKVSISAIKFQEMMTEKSKIVEKELNTKIKARPIPSHIKKNKFERLQDEQETRKMEAKRTAIAKLKATEAPFEFYHRDIATLKKKQETADLPPPGADFVPFRAKKIPWKVIVPLYKSLMDDAEAERERRVKSNAQQALSLSKLPPRMEAFEKRKKEIAELKARASSE